MTADTHGTFKMTIRGADGRPKAVTMEGRSVSTNFYIRRDGNMWILCHKASGYRMPCGAGIHSIPEAERYSTDLEALDIDWGAVDGPTTAEMSRIGPEVRGLMRILVGRGYMV